MNDFNDDDKTIDFSMRQENTSDAKVASDIFEGNEIEPIRLWFLNDLQEGKSVDPRHYWRKVNPTRQVECRRVLENTWFRFFSSNITPEIGLIDLSNIASDMRIFSQADFNSVMEEAPQAASGGVIESTSALILAGKLSSYQARKLLTGQKDDLIMGDYLILDFLGEGGMGRVLKAYHYPTGRVCALKIFDKKKDHSMTGADRFKREVMLAKRLMHPNIITAYDSGECEEYDFLAIEYIDGPDLSKIVKWDGPVAVTKAIDYMIQAADALAYAHRQQIIHRDVKPHNMLIDTDDKLKILDLGLGRLNWSDAEPGGGLTQTGQFLGTVDYLAPEQAVSARTADARSDIYALGATMYYILAGKVMFSGDSIVAKIFAHQNDERPSLLEANPSIPPALDIVYRRMTAKSPQNRIQTMEEISQFLRDLRDHKDIYIPPVPDDDIFSRTSTFKRDKQIEQKIGNGEHTVWTGGVGSSDSQSITSVESSSTLKWILAALVVIVLVLIGFLVPLLLPDSQSTTMGVLKVSGMKPDSQIEIIDNQKKVVQTVQTKSGDISEIELPLGLYTVNINAVGYGTFSRRVDFRLPGTQSMIANQTVASGILFKLTSEDPVFCDVLKGKQKVVVNQNIHDIKTVALENGEYDLVFHAPGCRSVNQKFTVDKPERKELSVPELEYTQGLELVLGSDCVLYQPVVIKIEASKDTGQPFSSYEIPENTKADDSSYWPIKRGLLPGEYTITAESEGYESFKEKISVSTDQQLSYTIEMVPTRVTRVVTALLSPATGASITVSNKTKTTTYDSLSQWVGGSGAITVISLNNCTKPTDILNLVLSMEVPGLERIDASNVEIDSTLDSLIVRIQTKYPRLRISSIRDTADWIAANQVFANNGRAWYTNEAGEEIELKRGSLPGKGFVISRIDLNGSSGVTSEQLKIYSRLSGLKGIRLTGVKSLSSEIINMFSPEVMYSNLSFFAPPGSFETVRSFCLPQVVKAGSFAEGLIAFSTVEGKFELWNHHQKKILLQKENMSTSAMSSDASLLAVASGDHSIELYTLSPNAVQKTGALVRHTSPIKMMTFSSNNKYLLTVSEDNRYIVWDTATQESTVDSILPTPIFSIALSPQGDKFILGSEKNATVFNVRDGALFGTLNGEREISDAVIQFTNLVFSPDGHKVVSCVSGKHLNIWGMTGSNSCRNIDKLDSIPDGSIESLSMNSSGSLLLAAGTPGKRFSGGIVIDMRQTRNRTPLLRTGFSFSQAGFSPSGQMIVGVINGELRFFTNRGQHLATFATSGDQWSLFNTVAYAGPGSAKLSFTRNRLDKVEKVQDCPFDFTDTSLFDSAFVDW